MADRRQAIIDEWQKSFGSKDAEELNTMRLEDDPPARLNGNILHATTGSDDGAAYLRISGSVRTSPTFRH